MTAQVSLPYSPAYLGNEAWQRQLVIYREAVRFLTPKEVTYELAITEQALSDALLERKNADGRKRRVPAEWLGVIKALLARSTEETAVGLLRQLVELDVTLTPYAIDDRVLLSPEEERDEYKRALSKTEAGREVIARVAKKARAR